MTDKTTKTLMMLPYVPVYRCFSNRVLTYSTDMALIKDKSFKTYATKYAKSEEEFFKE
jgi:cytochrome c peroxidase